MHSKRDMCQTNDYICFLYKRHWRGFSNDQNLSHQLNLCILENRYESMWCTSSDNQHRLYVVWTFVNICVYSSTEYMVGSLEDLVIKNRTSIWPIYHIHILYAPP